jgi:hypothetical protein
VVLNFKLHSAEGLSFGFVILLMAGDVCNLIGVIVTHGLGTQIACAIWFIFLDVVNVVQYAYYVWIVPHACPGRFSPPPLVPLLLVTAASATDLAKPYRPPELIGTLLGWLSTMSYATSRIPQIYHNFKRRLTDGLSIQFFVVVILENVTYAASIFFWDSSFEYAWQQMPWLVGSVGMLGFDFLVIGQFLVFGSANKDREEVPGYTTDQDSDIVSTTQ